MRIDPMIEISASRSCGGTRPAASGSVVATRALAVLGDDHVDVSAHVAVQLERDLMLAQLLDRLFQIDLVPVDLDAVLRLQRGGDVLVRDGAEGLVFGADPQAHDDGLVVDLIGYRLRLVAILGLALDRRVAQPLGLGLGSLPGGHRQLAAQEEVAAITVRDLLNVPGATEVVDIFCQQDPHFTRPPTWIDIRLGGLANDGFGRPNATARGGQQRQYRGHRDPTRWSPPAGRTRAPGGCLPGTPG